MKILLESNFRLLGSEDIDSIEFDSAEITLKDLLQTIADRSTTIYPQYVNKDGTRLEPGWQVHVNGRILDFCEHGIHTALF